MKHRLVYTFGLIALGLVALVAGPAKAQTTAAGPYYATPSWDQTLATSTRFVVLSNFNSDAVLDRETGLVWQRNPGANGASSGDYRGARNICDGASTGGRAGWRLPTTEELGSLAVVPISVPGTLAPPGSPFVNVSAFYWSATVNAQFNVPYVVGLGNCDPVRDVCNVESVPQNTTFLYGVWCVRGGKGVPVQ